MYNEYLKQTFNKQIEMEGGLLIEFHPLLKVRNILV
jgi:hypothetical protein